MDRRTILSAELVAAAGIGIALPARATRSFAPDTTHGPFLMVMQLYWPKPEALDGTWTAPPMERVS